MSDPVQSMQEVEEARPAPKRRKASMFDDPVVRAMTWVVLGLLVLYLTAVVSALFLGIIGNPAPRTLGERQLYFTQSAVKGGDHSAKALAEYVDALIDVKQYGQAQQVIDTAPKTALQSPLAELQVAQARLDFARKDYKAAIASADKAAKVVKANYEADLKKAGMNFSKSYGLDDHYFSALLIKALSQQASGDAKGAVKSYDEYLQKNPMESEVLVDRAEAKVQLKDRAGATADYKAALKYVPDNQRALEGLKKIGVQ